MDVSWSTLLHALPYDEAIPQRLGRDHWLICGWVKRQTNSYSWFQVKQIALWASSSKPSMTWKNVKYIPYRSQIWVWVVSFICRKSIPLTALIKHWNNYIRIYINLRKEVCVCFSLPLSLNRWPELSHELSWHFIYLSIHFLCQKESCHTCRQQRENHRILLFLVASLAEMCKDGQMFELLDLMGKRKKEMPLSDAKDCMKPFSYYKCCTGCWGK